MQMVSIFIGHHQQGSEGLGILDVHLGRGMKHGEATDASHEGAPQHAHSQQGGDLDGSHHPSQAHVDANAYRIGMLSNLCLDLRHERPRSMP